MTCMISYDSEEITTNVSKHGIALLTDVMTLRDRDLALSWSLESVPSYGVMIVTCTGCRQRSSAT